MLRLIVFLVIAAALAVVSVWLANHPGSVVIDWQGQVLQTNVGILILVFLVVAAVCVIGFELLRWLGGLPGRWRRHRDHAREVRGYQALTTGLIAAAAGNLSTARALHREAERLLPDRGSVLLLGAQTAQLEGKEEVAHLKFRQMLRSGDTELLGLRGLLAQAMRSGDRVEALSMARRAYRRSPTTPWVLTTLFELLTHTERWDEALNLSGEMQAQKLITPAQADQQRSILYHMQARTLQQRGDIGQALHHARRGLKLVSGFAPAAVTASELAQARGKVRLTRQILEGAWVTAPHPELARAYTGLNEGESAEQRLVRVGGRLSTLRPDHPELHVTVGELAIAAKRWDIARSSLERALALAPTARVYRLLAELERASGNPARAQDWLAQAIDAQPDHGWVCEDTGEVLPAWRPFGASGRFDMVRWAVPPRVATLLGRDHGSYLVAEKPAPTPAASEAAVAAAADAPPEPAQASDKVPSAPSPAAPIPTAEMAAVS